MWTMSLWSNRDGTSVPHIIFHTDPILQERCIHRFDKHASCHISNWVLFKSDASGTPGLGCVKEIVILTGPATSTGTEQLTCTVVLLQHMDIGASVEPYWMLTISFRNKWMVVDASVSDDSQLRYSQSESRQYTHSPFPIVYSLYCKLPALMPQPLMWHVRICMDLPRVAIDRLNTGCGSASYTRWLGPQYSMNVRCCTFNWSHVHGHLDPQKVSTVIICGMKEEVDGCKWQIAQGGGPLLQKCQVDHSWGGGWPSLSSQPSSSSPLTSESPAQ